MGLRLAVGEVTVLQGSELVRRRLMLLLDEDSGRGASGRATGAVRLRAPSVPDVGTCLKMVERARRGTATVVLVDRLTDGLDAADRRRVLTALRAVADGRVVLVDDADAVAALAVADATLHADPRRGVVVDPVEALDYLVS